MSQDNDPVVKTVTLTDPNEVEDVLHKELTAAELPRDEITHIKASLLAKLDTSVEDGSLPEVFDLGICLKSERDVSVSIQAAVRLNVGDPHAPATPTGEWSIQFQHSF